MYRSWIVLLDLFGSRFGSTYIYEIGLRDILWDLFIASFWMIKSTSINFTRLADTFFGRADTPPKCVKVADDVKLTSARWGGDKMFPMFRAGCSNASRSHGTWLPLLMGHFPIQAQPWQTLRAAGWPNADAVEIGWINNCLWTERENNCLNFQSYLPRLLLHVCTNVR